MLNVIWCVDFYSKGGGDKSKLVHFRGGRGEKGCVSLYLFTLSTAVDFGSLGGTSVCFVTLCAKNILNCFTFRPPLTLAAGA